MGRHARGPALRKVGPIYQARFTIRGRRLERSTNCSRFREAAKRAAELYQEEAAKADRGPEQRGAAANLQVKLAKWSSELKRLKSAPWHTTLEIYARAHWLSRWQTVGEITASAVAAYIGERLAAGASPVTVRKELSGLRRFLVWCKRESLIAEVPAWETPRGKSDFQALCLTPAQVERLLAKLPSRARHPKRLPVREYYTLMWLTGFRRGTMARLLWSDLDLKAGTVTVRPSADKREFDRVLPLEPRAVRVLKGLGRGVGLVFGPRDFREALQEAAERALGKETGKRVTNHTLRHSRLSFWASQSQDVAALQYLAGHRDLASTQRYVHSNLERARALLETGLQTGKKRGSGAGGEGPKTR